MSQQIKVLGIAPYESMKTLMTDVAKSYPEIFFKAYVGDLEDGLEVAKRNFKGNYDLIISRGATAKLIRDAGMPVIEVEISSFDILCSLKLATGFYKKCAIVSFADIAQTANEINSLLGFDIDIYTLESAKNIEEQLRYIDTDRYDAILCDMVVDKMARLNGINSFLITSGERSIQRAFNIVKMQAESDSDVHAESAFLRHIINEGLGYTIVFDDNKEILTSTLKNPNSALIEALKNEVSADNLIGKQNITKEFGGMTYKIKKEVFFYGKTRYHAFYFVIRKTPPVKNKIGMRYYSRSEAIASFDNSVFSYTGMIKELKDKISVEGDSANPIMISGEDGTGKESVAFILYVNSRLSDHPFLSIDCRLVNEKGWAFLFEHYNSPLLSRKHTIYFSNIDVLSAKVAQELLANLMQSDVCKRNKVIFSCVCEPGVLMSELAARFADRLCCINLFIPPLRSTMDELEPLVNSSINHLNVSLNKQVIGVEEEGLRLLSEFGWPHNLTQLKRVLTNLVTKAPSPVISTQDVENALQFEKYSFRTDISKNEESNFSPIDLDRTLEEINRDIIQKVLDENGGNQTLTAKKLGIGRTTLWRYINK